MISCYVTKMLFRGQLPGLKYAKGVNKWPVFFKNQFYDTYEEAKKAQGSELFHYYVIVTYLISFKFLFVKKITRISFLAMVQASFMVSMMIPIMVFQIKPKIT